MRLPIATGETKISMLRAEHTTASAFMQKLEASLVKPSTYNGELYLELHRGTLTNQYRIK